MIALPRPCLCLVTDRQRLLPGARTERDEVVALERFLDEACDAGIDLIQLRERDLSARAYVELVAGVMSRAPAGVRLVVNDRADVAHAGRAAGVHLPSDAPPVERVRALGPAEWIVGRSVHLPQLSLTATGAGAGSATGTAAADYLIFGTVFATASKPAGVRAAGPDGLRAAVAAAAATAASPPVLAIGGITPGRAAACREAGAAGLAAIGAFLPPGRAPEALGPRGAARAFRQAWAAAAGPR